MSISPTAKARTIQHMNKDHKQDLSHLLQHFLHLTPTESSDPEMLDIDLDSLTVLSGPSRTRQTIPFNPPMTTFDERRTRLVAMTHTARESLGITSSPGDSPKIQVGYDRPRGTEWITLIGVILYFICFAAVRAGLVEKSTVLFNLVDTFFPGGAGTFRWVVETIFWPVLGIHLGEAWWFERSRCRPSGIPRGSAVWFLWLGNVFFEGYGTFLRFDRLLTKARASH
ncbi:putative integral membrane [Echria macrotheca]|uniref:Integral membrane n=1 Tax=Echria macrotheca TaxID=438768 RepID=A0AAJ0FHH0_9PEZI|nr:putative integral membrane [Echria macrotheca]